MRKTGHRAEYLYLKCSGFIQLREPAGNDRMPKSELGIQDCCYHESQPTMPHPRSKGARALRMQQTLSQDGSRAPELLLSRISISLAAQSMGSVGALITASTNPCSHAASHPKGREPSGSNKHYPGRIAGFRFIDITNPGSDASSCRSCG